MAKHTFVTESHAWGDEKKTVEILSRTDVADIATKAMEDCSSDFSRKLLAQERKLAKAAEQATDAFKDASSAREMAEKLVETARETFRDVIEELLAPHYRLLAQHLGIEMPAEKTGGTPKKKAPGAKKAMPLKKKKTALTKTTSSRQVRKGGKPCRKR